MSSADHRKAGAEVVAETVPRLALINRMSYFSFLLRRRAASAQSHWISGVSGKSPSRRLAVVRQPSTTLTACWQSRRLARTTWRAVTMRHLNQWLQQWNLKSRPTPTTTTTATLLPKSKQPGCLRPGVASAVAAVQVALGCSRPTLLPRADQAVAPKSTSGRSHSCRSSGSRSTRRRS